MEQFAPHALTIMFLTIIILFVGFIGLKTIYDYIKAHITSEIASLKIELSTKLDAVKSDLNANPSANNTNSSNS